MNKSPYDSYGLADGNKPLELSVDEELDAALMPFKLYIQADASLRPINPSKCYDQVEAALKRLLTNRIEAAKQEAHKEFIQAYRGIEAMGKSTNKRTGFDNTLQRYARDDRRLLDDSTNKQESK